MKKFTSYALLALALLTVTACVPEPNFSEVPNISFDGFEHYILRTADRLGNRVVRDSVVLSVAFQDGDGDLGITSDEYSGKPSTDPKLKGVFNYQVRVFRKVGSTYIEAIPKVTYSSFFPPLKPDGRRGPIEGNLRFSQSFYEDTFSKIRKDTLKFRIKILDRRWILRRVNHPLQNDD